jgi:hypothetical protein
MQRINSGVAVVSGKIYVVGGWDGDCSLNTAARVAPSGPSGARRWQPLAEMSTARECPGVGELNNRLYAVGGTWGNVYHRSVEVYDVRRASWQPRAAMGVQRCGVGVVALGGKLYAIGGLATTAQTASSPAYEVYHSSVEQYDAGSNAWSFVAAMRTPRARAGVAVHLDPSPTPSARRTHLGHRDGQYIAYRARADPGARGADLRVRRAPGCVLPPLSRALLPGGTALGGDAADAGGAQRARRRSGGRAAVRCRWHHGARRFHSK